MTIQSVRHKGLRRLIERDDAKGVRPDMVDRVRKILTALLTADSIDGFVAGAPPGWRVHQLAGDRKGVWSISASGNWRITFTENEGSISSLDLEDYHECRQVESK